MMKAYNSPKIGSVRSAVFLAFFFVLSFRALQYLPGGALLRELWIITVFLFLVTIYLFDRMRKGFIFTLLEIYIFVLLVTVPLVTSIMAAREFGQPLLYGILAQRNVTLAGCVMLFLHYYRKGSFTLSDVERSLVGLSWVSVTLYTLLSLVLDPTRFVEYGSGFVGGGKVGEARFKFDTVFIVFGYLYYSFRGYWTKDWKRYLLSLPFLLYLIFYGGRSLLVAMIVSNLYFIWRWSTLPRLVFWLPKVAIVALLLVSVLFLMNPAYIVHFGEKFVDAFTVVISGEITSDVSANARIIETRIAWPYIAKHWVLGNGDLSNKWQWGYKFMFDHFYPSDIGIVGALYVYGLFGVLLFSIQAVFIKLYARRLAYIEHDNIHFILIITVKGFLLYYALYSIVTARFAHYAEISLLFISILYVATLSFQNKVSRQDLKPMRV